MEEWRDYKVLDFRCAIAVKTSAQAVEKYGILQATAGTIVDHAEMLVLVTPATRELRFPARGCARSPRIFRIFGSPIVRNIHCHRRNNARHVGPKSNAPRAAIG